jgi:hypothetical protein
VALRPGDLLGSGVAWGPRMPAMQAGLVSRRLTFRKVFKSMASMLLYVLIVIDLETRDPSANQRIVAAQQL